MNLVSLLIVGFRGAGKTSLLAPLVRPDWVWPSVPPKPTLGVDFSRAVIHSKLGQVRLDCWDASGDPRFRLLNSAFYRDKHLILYVIDPEIDLDLQLRHLAQLKLEISTANPDGQLPLLVFTKTDLVKISHAEQTRCEQALKIQDHVECSAKTGENMQHLAWVLACKANLYLRILQRPSHEVLPAGDLEVGDLARQKKIEQDFEHTLAGLRSIEVAEPRGGAEAKEKFCKAVTALRDQTIKHCLPHRGKRRLALNEAEQVARETRILAEHLICQTLTTKAVTVFENATANLRFSLDWRMVISAVVGAALGMIAGAILGALVGGAGGAVIGAAVGGCAGLVAGGFFSHRVLDARQPRARVSHAAENILKLYSR